MILHNYLSNSGRDLIYEYINSLPEAEKIDGYTVLQHMEKGEFDKVLFKRWEKKVYEVYFQKNNRVFYITVDKENIYLLHSCRKQKNKTETGSQIQRKNLWSPVGRGKRGQNKGWGLRDTKCNV